MSNAMHTVLGFVRVLVLVGLALAVAGLAAGGQFTQIGDPPQDPWVWGLDVLQSKRVWCGLLAGAVLVLEAAYWLTRPTARGRRKDLVLKQPAGNVTVSLRTVKDELARLADLSDDVVSLEPEVRPTKKGIDLELNVKLGSRSSVPAVSALLQDGARRWVAQHMGEDRVGQVRVNVRELVRESVAAAYASPRPSPAREPAPAGPSEPSPPAAKQEEPPAAAPDRGSDT